MKKFNDFTNESIRDKMTPVSEEDIKNKMGEEKYHIWKNLNDAKNSIKPPFEVGDVLMDEEDYSHATNWIKKPPHFESKIWYLKFIVEYNGTKWEYRHFYSKFLPVKIFDTWEEVHNQMKLDATDSFNKEKDILIKEINRCQSNVNDIDEIISNI